MAGTFLRTKSVLGPGGWLIGTHGTAYRDSRILVGFALRSFTSPVMRVLLQTLFFFVLGRGWASSFF